MTRHFLLLDVDNTLYSRTCGLVDQVDRRINRYLAERLAIPDHELDDVRHRLWEEFGTTLHGLMHRTPIDVAEYVAFVHDVDHAAHVRPDPALARLLARIPMQKIAITNGSLAHGRAVLDCLGVRDLFFRVYGLEQLDFLPKPYVHAYQTLLGDLHAHGHECVLVEDSAANLRAGRQLGMWTVHVAEGVPPAPDAHAVIASIHELLGALPR